MSSPREVAALKLCCAGEIRRLSVPPNALTFDELKATARRVFPHLSHVHFSWIDDENDEVVVDSDAELLEAVRVMSQEKWSCWRFEVNSKKSKPEITLSDDVKDGTNSYSTQRDILVVHDAVECDECGQNPITGPRFKCSVRENFDYCEVCEEKSDHLYPTVKIYSPDQTPGLILAVVDENNGSGGDGESPRNGKHRGVTCGVCQSRNFAGIRYKCTVRPDFDLCSTCEGKKTQPFAMIKIHRPNQVKSVEVIPHDDVTAAALAGHTDTSTERHANIRCNACGVKPIVGVRYKCSVRPDFDLCGACEAESRQPHPMLKVYKADATLADASPLDHIQVGVSNGLGWLRGISVPPSRKNHSESQPQSSPVKTGRGKSGRGSAWSWGRNVPKAQDVAVPEDEMLELCIKQSQEERARMETATLRSPTSNAASSFPSPSSSTSSSSFLWGTNASSASSTSSFSSSCCSAARGGRSLEQLISSCNIAGRNFSRSNSSSSGGNSSKPKKKVKLMARFVQDVTMPDGSQIAPCSAFYKTWRVRNDGPCDWPEGCHLVSAGGDVLVDPKAEGGSGTFRQLLQPISSGNEDDITVELYAPSDTGRHVGYFRLEDPGGSLFGQRLWADIRVTDADMTVSATLSPWEVVHSGDDVSPTEEEEQEEEGVDNGTTLKPGRVVKLHGLKNRPELNGQGGSCKRWDEFAGRWEVELHDSFRLVMLLPENLTVYESIRYLEVEEEQQDLEDEQQEEGKKNEENEQGQEQIAEEGEEEEQWVIEEDSFFPNSSNGTVDDAIQLARAVNQCRSEEQEQEQSGQEHEGEEEKIKQLDLQEQRRQLMQKERDDMETQLELRMRQQQLEVEQQLEREAESLALWSTELEVLREMGFNDSAAALPLLELHIRTPASMKCGEGGGACQEQGDGLQAVVWALLAEP